jgi:hypothetical protein
MTSTLLLIATTTVLLVLVAKALRALFLQDAHDERIAEVPRSRRRFLEGDDLDTDTGMTAHAIRS